MEKPLIVTLNLNTEQRDCLSLAVKGTNLNPFSRNNTVEVTADNVLLIREAVVKLHRSKFHQKTKNASVLGTCFSCERVIDKIDNVLDAFGYEAPQETTNDEDMAIVSVSVPSLTKVEEPEVLEEDGKEKLIEVLNNKPEAKRKKGKASE